jgi:hypothetical protein
MRKFVLLFIVICSSLFLTGCSFRVLFIVENLSHGNIIVKYQPKKFYRSNLVPNVKTLSESNKENYWEELAQDKFKVDEENGNIEITLAPNQILQIAQADPFWIYHNPYGEYFNIKSLSIVGKNGSVTVEGNQTFELFRPEEKGWSILPNYPNYIFSYRESLEIPL